MHQLQAPAAERNQWLLLSPARSLRGELGLLFVLLALVLLTVAANGFLGLYHYRRMAGDLRRVEELPVAAELNSAVGDLRIAVAEHAQRQRWSVLQAGGRTSPGLDAARSHVCKRIETVRERLSEYLRVLQQAQGATGPLAHTYKEETVAEQMETILDSLHQEYRHPEPAATHALGLCDRLQHLAGRLPAILQRRLNDVPDQVRNRYRLQIQTGWVATVASAALLAVLLWRFSRRVLVPLRDLIRGARLIARDRLEYRFQLPGRDEMAQLAQLLNRMIEKFVHTRERLDEQVQRLAEQKMRNQRLAVVGLLASGVSRQIEPSLQQVAQAADQLHRWSRSPRPVVEPHALERLRCIQAGAFACKQITQQLLQWARQNQSVPQTTELNRLVEQTLKTWRSWWTAGSPMAEIRWQPGPPAEASLAVQEFHIAMLALLRGLWELAVPGSMQLRSVSEAQHTLLQISLCLQTPAAEAEGALRHLASDSHSEEPSWLFLAAAMFAESHIRLEYRVAEPRAQVELRIPRQCTPSQPGEAA